MKLLKFLILAIFFNIICPLSTKHLKSTILNNCEVINKYKIIFQYHLCILMVPHSNWIWTVTTDPVWNFPHQNVTKYIKVSCYGFNMNIMQYFGKISPWKLLSIALYCFICTFYMCSNYNYQNLWGKISMIRKHSKMVSPYTIFEVDCTVC
jgi:hypothetical protein